MITQRLPLALPPHTANPELYQSGIEVFTQIYRAFEGPWRDLVAQPSAYNHWEPRTRDILARLYAPDLVRMETFDADLEYLKSLSRQNYDDEADRSTKHEQSLPQLQAFLTHTQTSMAQRPHVLLAYAWILYMALFSGGRWIRAQLQGAGNDFWGDTTSMPKSASDHPGFSFLYFPGDEDGEDIKREFRASLAEVETLLTPKERDDVVAESLHIFRFCILLVEALDQLHNTPDIPRSLPRQQRHAQILSRPSGDGKAHAASALSAPPWSSAKMSLPGPVIRPRVSRTQSLVSSFLACLFVTSFLMVLSVFLRPILPLAL